jgi:hypothetical protein
MKPSKILLILGDLAALIIVIVLGFAFHQSSAMSGRLHFTLVPFALTWLLAAALLGLYAAPTAANPKQLWRVLLGMLLAAPLASLLRSAWLGTPFIPIFAVIMGATSLLGLLVWRLIYIFVIARKGKA